MNRTGVFLFVVSVLFFLPSGCAEQSDDPREKVRSVNDWFILLDYDPGRYDIAAEDLFGYDMAIVDPDNHPPMEVLRKAGLIVAYVSIGEAESYRSYWPLIKGKDWIVAENPEWSDNYYVDVRAPEWRDLIINTVIERVLKEGFDGLFLDTVDTAAFLETAFPDKYDRSTESMIDMIKDIHERYKGAVIISNNGFSILDEIAPYLSGILVEDINSMIDFKGGGYKEVPPEERRYKIEVLEKVMEEEHLPIFNIDYADQKDRAKIKKYSAVSKALGFNPYVAEKELDRIYEN